MISLAQPLSITTRIATEDDQHLPSFDNTKLVAINTCPTWGVLRYVQHKAMPGTGRAMALEAGSVSHEVFAAVRLYQLRYSQNLPAHFEHHGQRIFGFDRWKKMTTWLDTEEDDRRKCLNFCLEALHSSDFYDDPQDKRRTVSNIEEACIAYIDRYDFENRPVWVEDTLNPKSRVGIELSFNIVVTFDATSYRFTGRIDGIHEHGEGKLGIHENKTAARLDEAWRQSFMMSFQITGYMIGTSLLINSPVREGFVKGMAIPLPRTYDFGGIVNEFVSRTDQDFAHWFKWFWHTTRIYEQHKDDPISAPRYTHSCNRYFRPCSFIPFCASTDEERLQILNEMVDDEWNPLHEHGAVG